MSLFLMHFLSSASQSLAHFPLGGSISIMPVPSSSSSLHFLCCFLHILMYLSMLASSAIFNRQTLYLSSQVILASQRLAIKQSNARPRRFLFPLNIYIYNWDALSPIYTSASIYCSFSNYLPVSIGFALNVSKYCHFMLYIRKWNQTTVLRL